MQKTRQAAAVRGESHYLTDTPCCRGHLAPRYTINGTCVECAKEAERRRKAKMREMIAAAREAIAGAGAPG